MRFFPTVAGSFLIVGTLCVPAVADEEATRSAAAHFDAGLRLYQEGENEAAAREYLAAFELAPHGAAMFNAGLAFEAAGKLGDAATAYAWAVEAGLDDLAATDARARIDRLAEGLGQVRITAPSGSAVTISGIRKVEFPASFHVQPGEVELRVTLPTGRQGMRRILIEAGQSRAFQLTESRSEAPVIDDTHLLGEPPPAPPSSFPFTKVGWVGIGVGATLGITSLALGRQTLEERDTFTDSGNTDAAARSRTLKLKRATNATWVTGALLAGAGVTMVVIGSKRGREVAVRLGPSEARLSGRF